MHFAEVKSRLRVFPLSLHYYLMSFQHAYTTTAINGTNFCASGKDAVCILARNSAKFASISCLGDFLLFLGKVRVNKNNCSVKMK